MRLSLQRGGPWPFPSGIPIPKTSLLARVRFFVTSSIADKRKLLQSDRSAGLFIRTLYEYRAEGKFRLHEYVVMPDHFHVLLTVDAGMSVERAVQFIKGGFAFRAGKELGMRSPVWQKGFGCPGFDWRGFRADASVHSQQPGQARTGQRGRPVSPFFSA